MAAMVRQTTGAIGYMEYTFAVQSSLNCIALRNRSGAFVVPSISSMQAAVARCDRRPSGNAPEPTWRYILSDRQLHVAGVLQRPGL